MKGRGQSDASLQLRTWLLVKKAKLMRFFSRQMVAIAVLVLISIWLGTVFIEDQGSKGMVGVQGMLPAFLTSALIVGLQGVLVIFWRQKVRTAMYLFFALIMMIPMLVLVSHVTHMRMWPHSSAFCLIASFSVGVSVGILNILLASVTFGICNGEAIDDDDDD